MKELAKQLVMPFMRKSHATPLIQKPLYSAIDKIDEHGNQMPLKIAEGLI